MSSKDAERTRGGLVEPLTKSEARQLWRAEAALGAYEDEKLEIYKKQLGSMADVFDRAREARGQVQNEYDARNQQVLDTLREMRSRIDTVTRAHQARLKEFSGDCDKRIGDRKECWQARLTADINSVKDRHKAISAEFTVLDSGIQKEIKDCEEHTTSETGPIEQKIMQHKQFLESQVAERKQQHEDFCASLKEQFDALRATLKAEGEARRRRCEESQSSVHRHYEELNVVQKRHDASIRERLRQVRAEVGEEGADRTSAQDKVVTVLVDFMEQLEGNINESQRRQEATHTHLSGMKTAIRFEQ